MNWKKVIVAILLTPIWLIALPWLIIYWIMQAFANALNYLFDGTPWDWDWWMTKDWSDEK